MFKKPTSAGRQYRSEGEQARVQADVSPGAPRGPGARETHVKSKTFTKLVLLINFTRTYRFLKILNHEL